MRIGIVVDSACDLPADYLASQHIAVLPVRVRVDDDVLLDRHDPQALATFLARDRVTRSHATQTEACSAEQIRDLFLARLVIDYDCVFCLTLTASRSPMFARAVEASALILRDYRPLREAANVPGPFLMRVIDTGNLFAAQGITAVECARMRAAGDSPGRIRQRLETLATHTYGYMLPRDLYYLRSRAKKKGDRSVGWFDAALGTALDIKPLLRGFRGQTEAIAKVRGFDQGAEMLFAYAARRVRAGLLSPTVCVSYGGGIDELQALPGYIALKLACEERAVEVFESPMSLTGMVNVGAGAVSIGFAAEEHAF